MKLKDFLMLSTTLLVCLLLVVNLVGCGGAAPTDGVNNAPTVDNALVDQTATQDAAFSYQFASNSFGDVDGDTLTYTAELDGGGALPSWLTFTAATRTFSGTPLAANVGSIDVKVTANDGNGGTVSDVFKITVNASTAPATLTLVKTDIPMRHDAAIKAGDDLIAYGTSTLTGVSYIVPSTTAATATAGTAVTNSALYSSKAFDVAKKIIFLVGSNTGSLAFQVSVYDTTTATITQTFDTTDIRLGTIPAAVSDPGHIQADGDYCAVICDQGTVTDGKIIKVIDVSGSTPQVISFDQNPVSSHFQVQQVAVDGTTKKVIVVAGGTGSQKFYVYDIDNPTTAPTEIAATNGVNDSVQMRTDAGYVMAIDDQAYPEAFLVDLTGNSIVTLTDAAAGARPVAIGGTGTIFGFFADDSVGNDGQAAVGTVPGPGFTKAATGNQIDGSTNNNGLVGYAGDMCIPPSGNYVFLANSVFQYSAGNASFTVPVDPDGDHPYFCPASRIDCSSNTVGFVTQKQYASTTDKYVGYLIIP